MLSNFIFKKIGPGYEAYILITLRQHHELSALCFNAILNKVIADQIFLNSSG